MKKLTTAAVALATSGAMVLNAGAATAATATDQAERFNTPTYAASQAFQVAATDLTREDVAQPAAIPGVVATAFVAGAAYGAGKVAAGWAAKKVIGKWDVAITLQPTMLD